MRHEKITVQQLRRRYVMAAAISIVILASLIIYGVLRPGEDDGGYSDLKNAILSEKPGSVSPEKSEELRKIFEKLSPETRDKLVTEIMRERLYQARERMKDLSMEKKLEAVDKMIVDFRQNFNKLNDEQKSELKERINSQEGKNRMKNTLKFYYTEFTPEERDLLDPFVNEVVMNIGNL